LVPQQGFYKNMHHDVLKMQNALGRITFFLIKILRINNVEECNK
jgi:hypothetical protein